MSSGSSSPASSSHSSSTTSAESGSRTLVPTHLSLNQTSPSSVLASPTVVVSNSLPALPRHWRNDYSNHVRPTFLRPILRGTFIVFCLIAYGQPNLETQWRLLHDTRAFLEEKDRLARNIGTVNIVATLLLATTATFVTTDPPRTEIIDYTQRGPYICLLASFGLLLFGVIVGSAAQFVLSSCTQVLVRKTLMRSRICIWIIMSALVYPFFAIGLATLTNIVGLLVAAWTSNDSVVKITSGFLFVVPVLLLVLFLYTVKGFDDYADSEGVQP